MDKRKSLINVVVSILFKVVVLVLSLLVKRYVIEYLGNEINGLNSLYASLVGMLSVAELGVGSAITFCMYKPIVEQDNNKVAALYQLFRKTYLVIGGIIFAGGCILIPFLPNLAKDYSQLDVNLGLTFLLTLTATVLTYLYGAKVSLINAYKNNYITTTIFSGGIIVQYILEILVLHLTGSFVWFLVCGILSTLLRWTATEIVSRRKHSDILKASRQTLDGETKSTVLKNIKAMFMHNIGGVLVNSTNSVIISAFIGVIMLGKYANYTSIIAAMVSVITLFFTPLTSIVGHLFVEDPEQSKGYFKFFHTFNFALGLVFFLGYYAVIDDLVALLFGGDLLLSKTVSFVITLNYFINFMRQSALLFRNATGTFYNDRWKPLFEGTANVILSVAAVNLLRIWFGEEIGLVGVTLATIFTNLLVCHIVEPYVLFRYGFRSSVKGYLVKNYGFVLVFILALLGETICLQSMDSHWVQLFANGGISLGISAVILAVIFALDKHFRKYLLLFLRRTPLVPKRKEN